MAEKSNLSLKNKLVITMLLITLVALVVLAISTYRITGRHYNLKASENITILNNTKKSRIEAYFFEKINNLQMVSSVDVVNKLLIEMTECFDSVPQTDSLLNIRQYNYICVYNKYINFFTRFINTYDFDDFYLVESEEATVLFNVQKHKDLGRKLYRDKKNTPLERLVRNVSKTRKMYIQDFESYVYANNQRYLFIGIPIIKEGKAVAVAVGLLSEKHINNIINESYSNENIGNSFLVGLNTEREAEYRNTNSLLNIELGGEVNGELIDAALKKEETGFTKMKIFNQQSLISYTPLRIKNLTWGIFTFAPEKLVITSLQDLIINNIWVILILLCVVSGISYQVARSITNPISDVCESLMLLSRGVLPKREMKINANDEISKIRLAFNMVVEQIKKYAVFADKIGKLQLDAKIENLTNDDVLGNALLLMQQNLCEAEAEASARRAEDEKQRWMTDGVAKFGEILRMSYSDIKDHADNIIQKLVEFLNVSQGGIFKLDENGETPVLRLLSCFAYDRKKFMEKEIATNEGLIGACFTEKETIYMTNIPDDYATISSGLGCTKPKSVLIVPLKMDMKILGVVELISFGYLEKYEIEFVEKIAEDIASSIYSSQITTQTQRLLNESREKSEQMAAQEEELRQNIEELQATQEEASRREAESSNVINAVEKSVAFIDLNLDGVITNINEIAAEILGVGKSELKNMSYSQFNSTLSEDETFLDRLISDGKTKVVISKVKVNDIEFYLHESFSLIRDCYDEPLRIVDIAYDVTEQIKNEQSKEF